jgi:hypothetical protein
MLISLLSFPRIGETFYQAEEHVKTRRPTLRSVIAAWWSPSGMFDISKFGQILFDLNAIFILFS